MDVNHVNAHIIHHACFNMRLKSNGQGSSHMWAERCIIWDDPTIGIKWPFEGLPMQGD
jgi:hypothetical protein